MKARPVSFSLKEVLEKELEGLTSSGEASGHAGHAQHE